MSHGSSIRRRERTLDTPNSQSLNHGVSVMRDFLESDIDFEWPENIGKCSGKHCDISREIPLRWKNKISDKTNASIDEYETGPSFRFQKTFVVKTIRDPDSHKAREMTANEVENMKDLRHPHVTALLGTFTYQARLHILIFPAACCDLQKFMKILSRGFEKDRVASQSDGTSTVDSDTINSNYPGDSTVATTSNHKEHDPQEVHSEPGPLNIPIDQMFEMLRGYFVCLSRALGYLHHSDVRHKDIKPENILIDESGSVILTDFGISRRFPKHTPHATNNEWKFTRKYASPEIMKDKTALRDDPSDVFSLGCVFLEMATLLLGKNLENLSDHYASTINDSSKEEAYYCNLGKVYSWLDILRASCGRRPVQEQRLLGETDNVQSFDISPDDHMKAALGDIRQMLDENPLERPESRELWKGFQHISASSCRDCDPRRPDRWKPSARQRKDAETGLNRRKSLSTIEETHLVPSLFGDIDSTMLSGQPIPNRSLGRSIRGSFPSTVQQKPSSHSHTEAESETELPTLQLNGDVLEESARIVGSRSPRLHRVQKKGMAVRGTNPGTTQASATTPPANVIRRFSTDGRGQNLDNVGSTRSLQVVSPPATKPRLSDQRAIRLDQQSRAQHQRRATEGKSHAFGLKKYTPHPQTRIIVYDVSRKIAFEDVFASLKDQESQNYPLPRFRQRVEIGDRADLIAEIDLRRLKLRTKMRRWMGDFPSIYVPNYSAQPLHTREGLSP